MSTSYPARPHPSHPHCCCCAAPLRPPPPWVPRCWSGSDGVLVLRAPGPGPGAPPPVDPAPRIRQTAAGVLRSLERRVRSGQVRSGHRGHVRRRREYRGHWGDGSGQVRSGHRGHWRDGSGQVRSPRTRQMAAGVLRSLGRRVRSGQVRSPRSLERRVRSGQVTEDTSEGGGSTEVTGETGQVRSGHRGHWRDGSCQVRSLNGHFTGSVGSTSYIKWALHWERRLHNLREKRFGVEESQRANHVIGNMDKLRTEDALIRR